MRYWRVDVSDAEDLEFEAKDFKEAEQIVLDNINIFETDKEGCDL